MSETPYQQIVCPECNGRPRPSIVHLKTTTGGRWEKANCLFCNGRGTVRCEQAEWRIAGKAMREDRLRRGVTLRSEAARLGISGKDLSDRESGRTKP